ncbi:serine/threonine protein phosphatase PrpC [Stackebrandtia albiflava]|uniref:Serine/threonine protein phosphatase PrpC n=1 Tax=Stackebrandtia albiflava TaxID=406432 RepID=A0A562VBI0_9ACTN|nr:protein phosphatase 2C domain-containing protein [Stackebrandtia albiflava]TWJ15171.1 serine/threonine protein phosphatase PrpC [Stackebrandtia albiflava]
MTNPTAPLHCPVCAEAADPSHRICEACGADLHTPPSHRGHWLSSAAPPTPCTDCGHPEFDPHGYCRQCGARQTRTSDRVELDMATIGAATDYGKRHHYNQDALAIGRHHGTTVAVVCDGVSSSTFGELAALAAAEAGIAETLDALTNGHDTGNAAHRGVTAAAHAAAQAGTAHPDNPPSCTFVSAVVDTDHIQLTWVGDSRAYWIQDGHATCLTVDDSTIGRLAAMNVPADDERYHSPYAAALLAWLGADAPPLEPNMRAIAPTGPGTLVVCSDGLSGYFDTDDRLATLIGTAPPVKAAAELTEWAREQGGRDNISVIVAQFPPEPATAPTQETPA